MSDESVPDIPGKDEVISWFGRWPSFHDAEVLELHLNRSGTSRLRVYAWNMTDRTFEKDHKQYSVLEKHAVVTFEIDDIIDLKLTEFSSQNVLSGIQLTIDNGVYHLDLGPCYGLHGQITASQVRVSIQPGELQAAFD